MAVAGGRHRVRLHLAGIDSRERAVVWMDAAVLVPPDVVVELTLQPLRRMPLDAAIVFSDIMVPLAAIGLPIRVAQGQGPLVEEPIRREADLARLRPLEPEQDEPELLEAIRLLRAELDVPLIGFSGAPFTLASYLIEGGSSRHYAHTKGLMYADPTGWLALRAAPSGLVR